MQLLQSRALPLGYPATEYRYTYYIARLRQPNLYLIPKFPSPKGSGLMFAGFISALEIKLDPLFAEGGFLVAEIFVA